MTDDEVIKALAECEFTPQNYLEDFHNIDYGDGSDALKALWAAMLLTTGELRSHLQSEYNDVENQVRRIKFGVFARHEDTTEPGDHDEDGKHWRMRIFFPEIGKTVIAQFYYGEDYNTVCPDGWTVVKDECGTSIAETQQVK